MDRRVMLKVKIKSLAAEAKIIRREAAKNKRLRMELNAHRRGVVRTEARHTQLAYAFVRGRDYHRMERNAARPPDFKRIGVMVDRYGVYRADDEEFDLQAARAEQDAAFKKWVERAERKD